jgi:beta-galactosidase
LPLLAGSGTIDITGKVGAEVIYQKIVWGLQDKPYIGVQPLNHIGEIPNKSAWRFTNAIDSWTWHGHEGKNAKVEVYSDAYAVRLELNGKCIKTKKLKDYRTWFQLPYQPGVLTAVALNENSEEVSRGNLETGGEYEYLTVIPDKTVLNADGQSLCYLSIEFTDKNGQLLPYVEKTVDVKVSGAGTLQGLGSAICKTDESYLADNFTSYRGRLLGIVRAALYKGKIEVIVSSQGVKPVKLILEAL